MDTTNSTFNDTKEALRNIRIKLIELSNSDLSNVHVGQDWSWIPFVKDHLEFLIEQTAGVEAALQDGPPPVSTEDLKKIVEASTKV